MVKRNRKEKNKMSVVSAEPLPETVIDSMDRRTLLKSAGITLSASAVRTDFASGIAASSSQHATETRGITQPMVGFMLGHEQFTVPQLVEYGAAAEQAGFDLLATSDHLQP